MMQFKKIVYLCIAKREMAAMVYATDNQSIKEPAGVRSCGGLPKEKWAAQDCPLAINAAAF